MNESTLKNVQPEQKPNSEPQPMDSTLSPAIGNTNVIRMGICLDCSYEDEVKNFDKDSEYNEFTGNEHYYPVCPKCGGGVEVGLSPCV